jgi:hypothetical protein
LFWITSTQARVEVSPEGLRRDFHAPKTACEQMGHHHSLIVTLRPPAAIDCMGSEILASDFCEKVHRTDRPALLRGLIDPVSEQVVCESGVALTLMLNCVGQTARRFCDDPKAGCEELKSIYGRGLDLNHFSVTGLGEASRLQCYFTRKTPKADELDLLEPLEGF